MARRKKVRATRKQFFILAILTLLIIFVIIGISITGKAVFTQEQHSIGPSSDEQACMMQCMGCTSIGVGCTGDSAQCQAQCNVEKPETTDETSCMEECVLEGCTEFDFTCQQKNQEKCEEECDMLGDRPDESDMSAEQLCITNCVMEKDPTLRCQNSQEGETGGSICQECAASCVHLYEGPCLDDTKLKEKQKECETCEHCYGEPVMGDSGEGWECIVSVECKDASSEWGDEPGTGEGIATTVGEAVGNVFEAIGDFFGGLFGGEKTSE